MIYVSGYFDYIQDKIIPFNKYFENEKNIREYLEHNLYIKIKDEFNIILNNYKIMGNNNLRINNDVELIIRNKYNIIDIYTKKNIKGYFYNKKITKLIYKFFINKYEQNDYIFKTDFIKVNYTLK